MDIPVILNTFNQLTTLRNLADQLSQLGYTNIRIIDNNSSYPPLLQWYNSCPYHIYRLTENKGCHAIWDSGVINEFQDQPYIVYSDSDLSLGSKIPKNFIYDLISYAEKYNRKKAGLALRIDDLPDTFLGSRMKVWEKQHWERKLELNVYDAHLDTTFSVIQPKMPFDYDGIRVAGDFTAEHIPWYVDFNNLNEEEKYYLEHSNNESTYKRYYNEWKKENNQ